MLFKCEMKENNESIDVRNYTGYSAKTSSCTHTYTLFKIKTSYFVVCFSAHICTISNIITSFTEVVLFKKVHQLYTSLNFPYTYVERRQNKYQNYMKVLTTLSF